MAAAEAALRSSSDDFYKLPTHLVHVFFPLSSSNSSTDQSLFRLASSPAIDHHRPGTSRKRTGLRESDYERLRNYTVQRRLGSGHDAVVYLATDRTTKREVAIKTMPKTDRSERSVARFRTEAELLLRTLHHPNIARAIETVEAPDAVHIVLEYERGGNLLDYINSLGDEELDERRIYSLFSQMVAGLAFAHSVGYLHHDVKLDNTLLDESGERVTLCDWAFACRIGDVESPTLSCGSPHYSAPELAHRHQLEPLAQPSIDVWSLGVALYAMAYRAMPFKPDFFYITQRLFAQPREKLAERPDDLHDLIEWMLTTDWRERATLAQVREHRWFRRWKLSFP